jgi:hypothetical protein
METEVLLAQPMKGKYNWHMLFVKINREIAVRILMRFQFQHCFVIDVMCSGSFNVNFDNRP